MDTAGHTAIPPALTVLLAQDGALLPQEGSPACAGPRVGSRDSGVPAGGLPQVLVVDLGGENRLQSRGQQQDSPQPPLQPTPILPPPRSPAASPSPTPGAALCSPLPISPPPLSSVPGGSGCRSGALCERCQRCQAVQWVRLYCVSSAPWQLGSVHQLCPTASRPRGAIFQRTACLSTGAQRGPRSVTYCSLRAGGDIRACSSRRAQPHGPPVASPAQGQRELCFQGALWHPGSAHPRLHARRWEPTAVLESAPEQQQQRQRGGGTSVPHSIGTTAPLAAGTKPQWPRRAQGRRAPPGQRSEKGRAM